MYRKKMVERAPVYSKFVVDKIISKNSTRLRKTLKNKRKSPATIPYSLNGELAAHRHLIYYQIVSPSYTEYRDAAVLEKALS